MSAYQKILVPTDLSDFSTDALRYASLLHDWLDSRITLLHADETHFPIDVLDTPLGYYLEEMPQSKVKLQERLKQFALEQLGSTCDIVIVQDNAVRAITQ